MIQYFSENRRYYTLDVETNILSFYMKINFNYYEIDKNRNLIIKEMF